MTEEWISKTAKKRQMDELQDLGMALTKLSDQTIKKIGLPEDLLQAIKDYKKITSNGATKRQAQYIGRLMRDIDATPIRAFLAQLAGENQAYNAFLQRVEQMRTHLIEKDDALRAKNKLKTSHPNIFALCIKKSKILCNQLIIQKNQKIYTSNQTRETRTIKRSHLSTIHYPSCAKSNGIYIAR